MYVQVLYLDDSGSMGAGGGLGGHSALEQGRAVLSSMGPLLRGPTRVLKFGSWKHVLAPREVEPPLTQLVQLGWDGSSGGTYMWRMVEEDVLERCAHELIAC